MLGIRASGYDICPVYSYPWFYHCATARIALSFHNLQIRQLFPAKNIQLRGWPENLKKIHSIFLNVSKAKRPKYLQQNSIWKLKNIYTKALLKPKNAYNKLCFESAYLGENVINLLRQKAAQNIAISLGYFICSRNHNEPPKVAQLAKNHPIRSPC